MLNNFKKKSAEDWRGSMIGNPDSQPLEEFDKQVNKCKQALRL